MEELGQGSSAVVYKCQEIESKQFFAVKVMRSDDDEKRNAAVKEFELMTAFKSKARFTSSWNWWRGWSCLKQSQALEATVKMMRGNFSTRFCKPSNICTRTESATEISNPQTSWFPRS
jgi:serine/threonine protein kinase